MSLARKVDGKRARGRAKRPLVTHSIPSGNGASPVSELSAPFDMPALHPPRFGDQVVDIRDHGAIAGSQSLCTTAIARAIEACADSGGGRVVIPAGKWL